MNGTTDDYLGAVAYEWSRPSAIWKPKLTLDGDKYCALYGDDLQAGVAGFGDTADAAMKDFDHNWFHQKVANKGPKENMWDEDGRCIHCGAGDDNHHSYTCPTGLTHDKIANSPPVETDNGN